MQLQHSLSVFSRKNLSGTQEVIHFSFLSVCSEYRELGS